MSLPFSEVSDGATVEKGPFSSNGYREVVLQQSVTMLAYMDKITQNSSLSAEVSRPSMLLGFTIYDLPILIGGAVGAVGLIIVIFGVFIIWHCCRLHRTADKAHCLDDSTPDDTSTKQGCGSIVHSDSVVFLGSKPGQVSTCAVGIKTDAYQSALTRSQSVPLSEPKEPLPLTPSSGKQSPKKRPMSQPVQLSGPFTPMIYSPKRSYLRNPYHHFDDKLEGYGALALPSIPEVVFRSSDALQDIASFSLCASCNALDESSIYSSLYSTIHQSATMKTRSLPSWGRSRPRPLSTEDDLNELYAKVSFSKKRKNRMRSDSAAAIAINKSRSTYLTIPFSQKDTDSLVDNEAVVVYDERTAL